MEDGEITNSSVFNYTPPTTPTREINRQNNENGSDGVPTLLRSTQREPRYLNSPFSPSLLGITMTPVSYRFPLDTNINNSSNFSGIENVGNENIPHIPSSR